MKRKLKNDFILILSLLIVVVSVIFIFKLAFKKGKNVLVQVSGETIAEYSLSSDIETVITTGNNNDGKNKLVIRDGKVKVKDCNCPDKRCENQKPIENEGETIVCLPHKLVIIIE